VLATIYRKDGVNEVCKLLPNNNPDDTSPKLYHRAYDLLNHFAPCTELCADKIKKGFRHPLYNSMLKRVNALFPKINNEVVEQEIFHE